MERMWQERADYGHFFYRIANGESAADAYDRIAGFNESLWRSFAKPEFPSVCVLVTHGLMTRVFLMKFFHWGYEYFQDLRNVNHCEFVVLQKSEETGKYVLLNELRTWSELKRRVAEEKRRQGEEQTEPEPPVPKKRWGGCPDGCKHGEDSYPKRPRRQDTVIARPQTAGQKQLVSSAPQNVDDRGRRPVSEEEEEAFPHQANSTLSHPNITTQDMPAALQAQAVTNTASTQNVLRPKPHWLQAGRDFGGSESGMATPASAGFEAMAYGFSDSTNRQPLETEPSGNRDRDHSRTPSVREADWLRQSGMGSGARADALGDREDESDVDSGSERGKEEIRRVEEAEREDKSLRGSVY